MKTLFAARRAWFMPLAALACLLHVEGCAYVPRDGPSADRITDTAEKQTNHADYIVVDLTKPVSDTVKNYHDRGALSTFADLPGAKPAGRLGYGDGLHITIWEANAQQGSVFAQQHGADIAATVDEQGQISVPYAGRFVVAGMTLSEVEAEIARRLNGKAYAPQVSVQLGMNVSNTVFLQGEIGHPGRFPLTPGGDRLLNLIALAGGPRLQPYEAVAQITRDGKSVSMDLYRIMNDTGANVLLSPGDSIIVSRRQDVFYAFGAVGHAGKLPFSEHTTTLLQALGAVSGLQDERADPCGIFIFRREPGDLAAALAPSAMGDEAGTDRSVVYRLDLSNPNSFFVLNTFPVRPSDIIYVSNAPLREYQKVVDSVIGTTGNLVNTGIAAATLTRD